MSRKGKVLTEEMRQRIEDLALTMAKPSASKIARKLGLEKDGAVYWYMLTRGLLQKKSPTYTNRVYERNGKKIYPYSPDHDALITSMRIENKPFAKIAAALEENFGIPRTAHSVQVRTIFLAAVDDEAAA